MWQATEDAMGLASIKSIDIVSLKMSWKIGELIGHRWCTLGRHHVPSCLPEAGATRVLDSSNATRKQVPHEFNALGIRIFIAALCLFFLQPYGRVSEWTKPRHPVYITHSKRDMFSTVVTFTTQNYCHYRVKTQRISLD